MKTNVVLLALLVAILTLAACTGGSEATPEVATPEVALARPSPEMATPTPCALSPIVVPTIPAEIPGYVQLDESTGLHMTGDYQIVELATWRLEITGTVATPLMLTYDELRCMPRIEQLCTLVCPGFFQDDATWAGASLAHILELAGAKPGFAGIMLRSADGYQTYVSREGMETAANFIAYEWEGEPVPILHGFPVRAVFPALDGNKWAKWLMSIEVQ